MSMADWEAILLWLSRDAKHPGEVQQQVLRLAEHSLAFQLGQSKGSNHLHPQDIKIYCRFFPVSDLMSLAQYLDNTCTSLLSLLLRLWKNLGYLVTISIQADLYPQANRCCRMYVRVCWGQPQTSFTVVFQVENTCFVLTPFRSQRYDPYKAVLWTFIAFIISWGAAHLWLCIFVFVVNRKVPKTLSTLLQFFNQSKLIINSVFP